MLQNHTDTPIYGDRMAFDPLSYPVPKGYTAIGFRHFSSALTLWTYAAGWSRKAVNAHRAAGHIIVNYRIPQSTTFLLLIREDDANGQ